MLTLTFPSYDVTGWS